MAHSIPVNFRPGADGLVKILGPLETSIMQVLWQQSASTVRQVHRALNKQRQIAYTTVLTSMQRLAGKGLLTYQRSRSGPAYIYTPTLSQEEFTTLVVHQVLESLLDEYCSVAVDSLVAYIDRRDPRALQRVIDAIERHTQEARAVGAT
jgi:predicted transcriptional regulator